MADKGERLEKECTCLFCNQKFKVKDIVFQIVLSEEQADQKLFDERYSEHIKHYKGIASVDRYRLSIDWTTPDVDAKVKWDENGLPRWVRGELKYPEECDRGGNTSFFDNLFASHDTGNTVEQQGEKIIAESAIRVCPHCHMTIIDGFCTDEEQSKMKLIRLGLLGGMRTGKTTYLVVVSKFLEEHFSGSGDRDVHLGTVKFTPECKEFIDYLYKNGIQATTVDHQRELGAEDPRVLPVLMRITPHDHAYSPFLLMLQDIPGEYMKDELKDQQMLTQSRISESTDLLMLVDSNHFVKTRQQQSEDETENYGAYCHENLKTLFVNYEALGEELDKNYLSSIQIALSKADFLVEADKRLEATMFSYSGDKEHRDAISEKRLKQVDRQVRDVLYSSENGGYGVGDLINEITTKFKLSPEKDKSLYTAYTAVASKYVPGNLEHFDKNGEDVHVEYSQNVIEPLLNVFLSHHLLPVKREHYKIKDEPKS